jgi:hypothetical protein
MFFNLIPTVAGLASLVLSLTETISGYVKVSSLPHEKGHRFLDALDGEKIGVRW